MRQIYKLAAIVALGLLASPLIVASQNPYGQPMNAESFLARAYVTDPGSLEKARSMGLGDFIKTVTPEAAPLVVVQVIVKDYFPRALSPVLLADGVPVSSRYQIEEGQGDRTIIGFLVEGAAVLKDGSRLSIRYGDDKRTESKAKGVLEFGKMEILDQTQARDAGIIR